MYQELYVIKINFKNIKLYNKFKSAELIKQDIKGRIDKYIPLIIDDINTGFKLENRLEEIINASGANKKVELGYADFLK